MNGMTLTRPVFLDLDNLPKGYNDEVNPYANPPRSTVDLRAMFRYAAEHGKKMIELTRDEVKQFEI